MGLTVCANDPSVGPGSTCRSLDFTLYFENWVLCFGTDLTFVLVACVVLTSLLRRKRKIERLGLLFHVKVFSVVLLLVFAAMRVGEVSLASDLPPSGNMAAAGIALVSSIAIGAVSLSEHVLSVAPSTLVVMYSLIRAVFNGALLRTYSSMGILEQDRLLFLATAIQTGSFVIFLAVELVEKRSLLLPQYRSDSVEAISSSLKRMTYSWLIPVLWKGHRADLSLDDLKAVPMSFRAEPTREALIKILHAHPEMNLFQAVFKAFGYNLLWPVMPRIILLLLTFAQPLLLNDLVTFLEFDEPASRGWAIVGGFVAVYGLMIVATAVYWEKVFYNVVQIRAALVGALYMKSLRLSSQASKAIGGGAASTHMSTDVEFIAQMFEFVHEVWDALLSTALALIILYNQAGWPAFLPIPVFVFILTICGILGVTVGKVQGAWLGAVDKRTKFMSSILNNFLSVKWFNYESLIAKKVAALRDEDVKGSGKLLNMMNIIMTISNNGSILCTLSVLGTYAALQSKGDLGPSRLFTIVTTLGLLNGPLMLLGQYAPAMAMGYASMMRIATFLKLEERPIHNGPEGKDDEKVLLRMEGASFSWDSDSEAFLKDIDFSVSAGDIVVLLGKVGSGKSMILRSLIGETRLTTGQFATPPFDMAYAGQDAFIMPGTIRENILFGKDYDEGFYEQVLHACAMHEDLDRMSDGDQTPLQADGGSLSGGQRQRIALARAVYAGTEVVLLDCSFSALDAKTEDHVFGSLFGSGGLLKGKTVVLATHNVQHTTIATMVAVLEAGRITNRGTVSEIRSQGYNLAEYAVSEDGAKVEGTRATEGPKAAETKAILTSSDVEAAEDLVGDGISTFLFYGRVSGWSSMTIWLTLMFFTVAATLGSQGYLQRWSIAPSDEYRPWIGGYAGLSVAIMGLTTAMFAYFIWISRRSSRRLHQQEVDGVFYAAPSFFMRTPTGQILNRFSEDIAQFDTTLPITILSTVMQGIMLLGTLIIVIIPAPWMALTLLALIPFYVGLVAFYLGTSKQLQKLELASKSPLYTLFGTTLSGVDTIRAFGAQQFFQSHNDLLLNASQGPYYHRLAGMRLLRTGLTLITFVLAVGLPCMAVGLRSSSSASLFALAISNLTGLTTQLNAWFMSYTTYENSTVSLTRIRKLVDLPPEYPPEANKIHGDRALNWPSKGSIEFKGVDFRYKQDGSKILSNVSFSVVSGLKVGICGRTGAGKSTIVLSILRAVDASLMSGSILIDGVDITTLDPAEVRRSVSIVTQEPFLWESSLRDNLDLDQQCTDAQIWEALDVVGMKDPVTALPEKLETILQGGGSFSRGERQLVCMARVLLRRRKIVILDEATSSLDTGSDTKIIDVVNSHLQDQTVLAVAHRISTIIGFDLIIVMSEGRIQEIGSPQELLANRDSHFRSLAFSQGLVEN